MTDVEFRGLARMAGSLEFFAPFKGTELELLLSHIQLYDFERGEAMFKPGDPASALFILYQGGVRITLERKRLWLFRKRVSLEAGSLFGEMALLGERIHSAKASAVAHSSLFVLFKADFQSLLKRSPAFDKHVHWLAESRQFENGL